jgi:hypothetical protein
MMRAPAMLRSSLKIAPPKPCWAAVDFGVNHVGGHDAGQRCVEPLVGRSVVRQNRFQAAFVNRDFMVRVGFDKTVTREVFAAVHHAGLQQAVHQTFGQQSDDAWVTAKGAVSDNTAFTKVQVKYRREAEINPAAAQLCSQHVAASGGRVGGGQLVFNPQLTQSPHRGQVGKTIGFKALHAPAFVVHANQQIFANAFDRRAQADELRPALPIAGKQNDAACEWAFQATAVVFGQACTGNVDDEGSVLGHVDLLVTINSGAACARIHWSGGRFYG